MTFRVIYCYSIQPYCECSAYSNVFYVTLKITWLTFLVLIQHPHAQFCLIDDLVLGELGTN